MLILINVYWMLSLAWQKHWMVKVLHSQISILPNFQLNLENLASLNACFPLFHAPFLNWPRSSSVFVTCEIIKYKGFHRYKSTSHCLDSIFIIPMQTEFLYLFSFSDIKAEWQIIQCRQVKEVKVGVVVSLSASDKYTDPAGCGLFFFH